MAESLDPLRLTRVDVGALITAFVAILTVVVTSGVPVEVSWVDGLRHGLIGLALTSLTGVMFRLTWRHVRPAAQKKAQIFLDLRAPDQSGRSR